MSDDVVLVDVAERVATITLNRPESRNAINSALGIGLARTIGTLEADDSVDVMILTGADAGVLRRRGPQGDGRGDPPSTARRSGRAPPPTRPTIPTVATRSGSSPPTAARSRRTKLLIGAINGTCITGGFELALNCDLLVASERARFADTHTRVGIIPGFVASTGGEQRGSQG